MVNWDDLLSYSTVKVVKIRDRRLGILHYIFMFAVVLYIAFYAIWWNQGYLRKEVPVGSVRATIKQPDNLPDLTTLTYCRENQTEINGKNNFPCIYMTGNDVVFPAGQVAPLFLTTRTKTFTRSPAPVNCNPPNRTECVILQTSDSSATTRYYVAGIEDYTVFMDHIAYGLTNDFVQRSNNMKGEVWKKGKEVMALEKGRIGDIFTIRELLSFAGVSSLDELSTSGETYRYDGVHLLVVIEYFNRASKPTELKYRIKVKLVEGEDTTRFDPDTATTSSNRHGVVLTFVQTGIIGRFHFPTLLSSIVGGLVLTGIATTIVDLLALYVLPEKKIYNENKYQLTEYLKDMRKSDLNDAKELHTLGTN